MHYVRMALFIPLSNMETLKERNGRYFTDFTIETFSDFIKEVPEIYIEEKWISTDVRPGRNKEKWLNLILRKKDS